MPDNNYKTIVEEMETGTFHKEVWLKAIEESGGKHASATSQYIKIRSEQLYLQNTPFYKRVLHILGNRFNPKTKAGLSLIVALVVTGAFVTLVASQPTLKENSRLAYQKMCVEGDAVIGMTQQDLIKRLGAPSLIDTSGSAFLVYVYNPSSAFCFSKERFDFKIFVDTRTARVTGWEENPLLRATASVR